MYSYIAVFLFPGQPPVGPPPPSFGPVHYPSQLRSSKTGRTFFRQIKHTHSRPTSLTLSFSTCDLNTHSQQILHALSLACGHHTHTHTRTHTHTHTHTHTRTRTHTHTHTHTVYSLHASYGLLYVVLTMYYQLLN